MSNHLKAPFPWFGGKSRVASLVWSRFGDVPNYVEPFFGSGAVLLMRPHAPRVETVNDKDCYLSNFWRALRSDPEAVAAHADWPVNEADLHARHLWLVQQTDFRERMKREPEFYDAKIAGWWVWGLSQWIGSGWCSKPEWTGRGSGMQVTGINALTHATRPQMTMNGIHAKRPNFKKGGSGIHRVSQQIPVLNGGHPEPIGELQGGLLSYFHALADRLRRVRVCCGDWKRIMGPSPTFKIGLTGVFLDPPYSSEHRDAGIYNEDSLDVALEVREWALKNGDNPLLRIALCGYEGEHELPGWECVPWKAAGGYGNKDGLNENAARERIWFSPHCLKGAQLEMFRK